MECCCNSTYQKVFNDSTAKKDLKSYQRKGVKRSSRPLLNIVKDLPVKNGSLLDIGGGIGALSFELFNRGLAHSTQVDISEAYVSVFLEEAEKRQLREKVQAHAGDFLQFRDEVEPADLVTLDKVICCYENYEDLISTSVSKARRWYAYTLPRDVWWVKWVQKIGQKVSTLFGSKFQSFVHSVTAVEEIVTSEGFRKIATSYHRQWMTVAFEKGKEG